MRLPRPGKTKKGRTCVRPFPHRFRFDCESGLVAPVAAVAVAALAAVALVPGDVAGAAGAARGAAAVATRAATRTATVTTAAARARAVFAGLGFIDGQGAAVALLTAHRGDRGLRLGVVAHLHEAEPLRSAGLAVVD